MRSRNSAAVACLYAQIRQNYLRVKNAGFLAAPERLHSFYFRTARTQNGLDKVPHVLCPFLQLQDCSDTHWCAGKCRWDVSIPSTSGLLGHRLLLPRDSFLGCPFLQLQDCSDTFRADVPNVGACVHSFNFRNARTPLSSYRGRPHECPFLQLQDCSDTLSFYQATYVCRVHSFNFRTARTLRTADERHRAWVSIPSTSGLLGHMAMGTTA